VSLDKGFVIEWEIRHEFDSEVTKQKHWKFKRVASVADALE
jgi:hypothetical protein